MDAIELDGLTRNYGERTALGNLSLRLPEGGTLVVFGANGAGKSTLLRVLAGLLRPHGGSVRVAGCSLPQEAWRMRGQVGLLGHEPMLYRALSARENLRYHATLHGVSRTRVEELLEAVGMARRAAEPVQELSRGMVQRIAACRAVLHSPGLLLLDEPWSNLDPAGIRSLEPLIGAQSGRTRVLSSHDPAGGLAQATHVLGLRQGRARLMQPAAEVQVKDVQELYA